MAPRRALVFVIAVVALQACERVSFPTQPPLQMALRAEARKPSPPPPPRPVPLVAMSTEARSDVTELLIFEAVILLFVLMTCLMTRARHAAVHAGISAAFLGPIIALFLGARHFSRVLFGMTADPSAFGRFALSLWDVNQPLVFSLYGSTAILLVLLVLVSLTKASGEKPDGSVIVSGALLLGVIGATVSFLAFFTMNRMILAAIDPVETDRIRRFVQSMSIAAVSSAIGTRLVVTATVSAASALLLGLTIALSFVMLRRVGRAIVLAAAALAIMVAATLAERSWSELLATAARTGRVPANAKLTPPQHPAGQRAGDPALLQHRGAVDDHVADAD